MIGYIEKFKCPFCKKMITNILLKHKDYEVITTDVIGKDAKYFCIFCNKELVWNFIKDKIAKRR